MGHWEPTGSAGQGPEGVCPRLSHTTWSPRFGLCQPVHLLSAHPSPHPRWSPCFSLKYLLELQAAHQKSPSETSSPSEPVLTTLTPALDQTCSRHCGRGPHAAAGTFSSVWLAGH